MPGAMEDNKWELKYGQIAILEKHTLGLGLKKKNFGLKEKRIKVKFKTK